MPLRINTNIPALNTRRILGINNRDLQTRIERLSSGLRINRAADDAAGLSVSEGMRAELSGLQQAVKNAEQAQKLMRTGEGALNEVNAILLRMRTLANGAASDTLTDEQRDKSDREFLQQINEIDRIASVTEYNSTVLLTGYGNTVSEDPGVSDALASATTGVVAVQISGAAAGTYTFVDSADDREITLGNGVATQTIDIGPGLDRDGAGDVVASGSSIVANFDRLGIQLTLAGQRDAEGLNPASDGYRDSDLDGSTLLIEAGDGGTFQVGPRDGAVHRINLSVRDMRASGVVLGLKDASISRKDSAQDSIAMIDLAIKEVTRQRSDIGALENRLGFNMRANENTIENLTASEAAIREADWAEEVSAFTRAQILVQSGVSMLAQANQMPQSLLKLFQ